MHGKLFPHVYILWASVKLVWQQQILYAQKLTRPVYDLGFHVSCVWVWEVSSPQVPMLLCCPYADLGNTLHHYAFWHRYTKNDYIDRKNH